jgi:hypothetical protein
MQSGACPTKTTDNGQFPFTSSAYSPLNVKIHFLFGNLSRADVRLNTLSKKPFIDFFDKNQDFLVSARHLPKYGFFFFHMLYVMAPHLGDIGKLIRNVKEDDDVDKIIARKIKT